jgi:transcriptional regulator with XRE-family HTH domain
MEHFHQRLKKFREARGMTMKAFAQALEVPVSTYRGWEYGGAIQGQPYIKMARILEVGLYELLSGEKIEDQKILVLLERAEKLHQEIKRELLPFC